MTNRAIPWSKGWVHLAIRFGLFAAVLGFLIRDIQSGFTVVAGFMIFVLLFVYAAALFELRSMAETLDMYSAFTESAGKFFEEMSEKLRPSTDAVAKEIFEYVATRYSVTSPEFEAASTLFAEQMMQDGAGTEAWNRVKSLGLVDAVIQQREEKANNA